MYDIDLNQLARVTTLIREGRLPAAEAVCRELLTKAPGHPAATHLLGLIRKDSGDPVTGERLMRESIAAAPAEPEFRFNLANLLRRLGRTTEAEPLYRQTLQMNPAHRQAHTGLVRTLGDMGKHGLAEAQCRALLTMNERDAQAWSLLALTLRNQMRMAEAEQAYRRAIALDARQGPAHHDLGSLLIAQERAEEGMRELRQAESLGVKGLELAFNRGVAMLQLYRIEEAEREFEQAVAANPLHGEAQLNLARLRFMRGEKDFTRTIAAAAAAHRGNPSLQILLSQILARAGDLQRAETVLLDLRKAVGPTPELATTLAEILLEAGRLKEAETEAIEAARAQPGNPGAIDKLVTILLCRGRPEDALPFIRRQRQLYPSSQGWIAYEAVAARLLGQALYRELYDYGRFVRTYDIEAPTGWSSMQELNAALARALNARHAFRNHPLDQSLRNGSQTARSLTADNDPAIQAILKIFELPIRDYQEQLGTDAAHPLSARNRHAAIITGAWSVQLRREGFHVNHVHPQGWISSAYYVSVPDEVNDESLMSGWLKFGETRYPVPGITPEGVVQPRPGRLVLFPSYMWHGTNAIHGEQPRTTIAFDAVPGRGEATGSS